MPEVVEKGKGALTHKIGPLPLWGWAAAGVAAVVVVKKVTGGAGGSGPGLVTIPSGGSAPGSVASAGNSPVVNPSQNAAGGADTSLGASVAPWWATAPAWWNATPGVPLTGQPSTNGSVGNGPATTTPSGAAPTSPSWWSRLTNPAGNIPSGAAVTTIAGTTYSLSSDALSRAGITGASVPTAPAAPPAATTASSPAAGPAPSGGSPLDIARRAFANAGVAPGTPFSYQGQTYKT